MKYLIKSVNIRGSFIKWNDNVIFFDTEDIAKEFMVKCTEVVNTELTVIPVDEDIIIGNSLVYINYNDIKDEIE